MRLPAILLAALPFVLVLAGHPAFAAGPAGASGPAIAGAPPVSGRLDPRLAAAATTAIEPIAVWVEFADKGETSPADLAERLAAAARSLTPEARRRRLKAHVEPLVDWLDLPLEPRYLRSLADAGFAAYGQSRWFNRVAVRVTGARLAELAALPFVRHLAPVELARPREPEPSSAAEPEPAPSGPARHSSLSPAEMFYGRTLTQLQRLNVPAVHDSGYIGTGVRVCMLDDGFNWYRKHEALRNIQIDAGHTRDFIRGGSNVQDTVSDPASFVHGTTTLSVLAGNAPGIYIGPGYGSNLSLGRTEYDPTEKPIEMVFWGMGAEWADSLGCDIISSSLGYNLFPDSAGTDITYPMLDGHSTIVTRAAEIAAAKGMLVVISAGNGGFDTGVAGKISAPADANGDSVLAIAAVDSFGVRASFSSKGPTYDGRIKPDLAAQGRDVLMAATTGNPNSYTRENGTSFSAPLVAGLAACLMQARPTWPPVLIVQALKHTASRAAQPDTLVGWGIPDAFAVLRYTPDTLHVPGVTGPLSLRYLGPNPLRRGGPAATVRVSLGTGARTASYHVRVLDAGGRIVRELASGPLAPGGSRSFEWRGDDAHGRTLVPGLYFLALEGAGRREALRVVVLR
ncbi:MAG TPA: S8 family serine peptidase [Candidatus Eisenbacteria bacterium]